MSQTNVDFVNREVFAQKGSYLFRYYKERNMITYFWCDVFENVEWQVYHQKSKHQNTWPYAINAITQANLRMWIFFCILLPTTTWSLIHIIAQFDHPSWVGEMAPAVVHNLVLCTWQMRRSHSNSIFTRSSITDRNSQ